MENLGGTDDAYEHLAQRKTRRFCAASRCLDLSDNDLIKLGNFPPLKRRSRMPWSFRFGQVAGADVGQQPACGSETAWNCSTRAQFEM